MTEMWQTRKGQSTRQVENPTSESLTEWIMALDGEDQNHIHMNLPIGRLSIYGGGGDSGRVSMTIKLKDAKEIPVGGVITDPDNEGKNCKITLSHDMAILPPKKFSLTLSKEKACEIGAHLLEHSRFPKDITWHGVDLSAYQ